MRLDGLNKRTNRRLSDGVLRESMVDFTVKDRGVDTSFLCYAS